MFKRAESYPLHPSLTDPQEIQETHSFGLGFTKESSSPCGQGGIRFKPLSFHQVTGENTYVLKRKEIDLYHLDGRGCQSGRGRGWGNTIKPGLPGDYPAIINMRRRGTTKVTKSQKSANRHPRPALKLQGRRKG